MEYISIPKHVNDINNIYSKNIMLFINKKTYHNGKIPMDSLRALYRTNKEMFFDLIDEFALRDFVFHTNKSNNILPDTSAIKAKRLIKIDKNKSAFKKINFSFLGLSSIVRKFNIDSDLFFNNIPVESFKTINASIDLDNLIQSFKDVGFSIYDISDTELIDDNQENVRHQENQEMNKRLKIKKVFSANKFNSFLKYCARNSLEYIDEIHITYLDDYRTVKEVGPDRVNAVKKRLKKYNIPLERNDSRDNLLISQVFFSNSYNFFKTFCKDNKLEYVDELTSKVLAKFKNTKNVGPKRYKEVIKKLNTLGIEKPKEYVFDENLSIQLSIKETMSDQSFIEYCDSNNIYTLDQIKYSHIEKYSDKKGIGKTKLNRVKREINNINKRLSKHDFHVFTVGSYISYLAENTVREIYEILDVEYDESNKFVDFYIKDLESKDIRSLKDIDDIVPLYKLTHRLSRFSNRETITKYSFKDLSEDGLDVLNYRFNRKLTLEEAGKLKDLTRERIRQIEKKSLNKIYKNLKRIDILVILKLVLGEKKFYQYDEMSEFFGEENSLLFNILMARENIIYYLEKYNIFFTDLKSKEIFEQRTKEIKSDLPNFFKINNIESALSNYLAEGEEFDYVGLLMNEGYKKYGEFYSEISITKSKMMDIILEEDFTNPVTISEEDYLQINSIAKSKYNFDFNQSLRAFDGLLRGSENIILIDKGTFQYFDPDKHDISLIEAIKQYIVNELNNRNVINIEEVFIKFKKSLNKDRIYTKYHLYSIIKIFYDDEFSIGKGNTLNIYKNESKRIDAKDRLIQEVRKSNNVADKNELEKILKWPRYKIDITISKTEELIPWGKNTVKIIGDILNDKEFSELSRVIEDQLSKGYTTSSMIYSDMVFNPILSEFRIREKLDNHNKLRSILRKYFPDLKGANFLHSDDTKYSSIFEVLLDKFKEETSRKEIESFLRKLGYKEVTISHYIDKIIDDKFFIEIDQKLYLPYKNLDISDETIDSLVDYVNKCMGSKEYISIRKLEGYRKVLPKINHRWNPNLISSLLQNKGFRKLEKKYDDYRNDMIVLVKESSQFYKFSDLASSLIINKYEGNMHESSVYDFLHEEGLLKRKEYGKHLPKSILEDSDSIKVDELGIVKVR